MFGFRWGDAAGFPEQVAFEQRLSVARAEVG